MIADPTTATRRQAIKKFAQFLLASPLAVGLDLGRAQAQASASGADALSAAERELLMDMVNVFDFKKRAQEKLDPLAWDYMAEGGKDEVSLREGRTAFDKIIIRPRFLIDVHNIDISTDFLGHTLKHPIFIDPAGGKNCFYPDGEQEVARAAAAADTMMFTNGGIESVINSGNGPKNWWQYTTGGPFRTKNTMLNFVERVEDQGATGICFTVDNMHVSHRERSIRNKLVRNWCNTGIPRDAEGNLIRKPGQRYWRTGDYPSRAFPTPTWDTVRQLREATDLPVILKGLMIGEDVARAVEVGAAAVVVSNHGARQLDHTGSTIEALEECVKAADGKIPVLVDGGFRRGTDILKALAMGATAVGVARPYLWGLATFGQEGVARVIELLRTELALDMAMSGVANISYIDRKLVRVRG